MTTFILYIIFIIGLVMIIKGGDIFLNGAIGMAKITGISAGIIGATIVSIATTLPELFVSTIASYEGLEEMAIGNALGTYICNIALIIGLISIIKPIKITCNFNVKGIMLIAFLVIFYILASDGFVSRMEGLILLSLVLIFFWVNALEHKIDNNKRRQNQNADKYKIFKNVVCFLIGAIFVITGSHLLLDSAVKIAASLHIPNNVISLSLLALGTSLPELVTAISALIKNEQSISIGNILGANIYNLTIIIGLSALVSNNGLTIYKQTLNLDAIVAMIVTLLFVGAGALKKEISRLVGALLLIVYLSFLWVIF